MKDLRVAAVCMKAEVGDIQGNLDRIEYFAAQAASDEARIVCYPELAVTGYTLKPTGEKHGDWDYDKTLSRVLHIARKTRTVLLIGLVEPCKGKRPFIAHIVAGPKGALGRHHKTHLSPLESEHYQAGRAMDVFRAGGACFGLQLCYEAHFPEISAIMALKGAEILFVPHASPRGDPRGKLANWLRHLPARAFDNAVFVVACNQVGRTQAGLEFPGVALFLGPDGRAIRSYAGKREQVVIADLKGSDLKRMRSQRMGYFLPARRPDLYSPLLMSLRTHRPGPPGRPPKACGSASCPNTKKAQKP
jgi:N-carbamoylputrescine amidase